MYILIALLLLPSLCYSQDLTRDNLTLTGSLIANSIQTPSGGTTHFGFFSNAGSYTGTCDASWKGLFAHNQTTDLFEYCNGTAMVDWPGGTGTATGTSASTTNFNNNLSSADDTVQKALDTLDNMATGSGAGVTEASGAPAAGSLSDGEWYHNTADHKLWLGTPTGMLDLAAGGWTINPDTEPDAYAFTAITSATVSTLYTSNSDQITGISNNIDISITGNAGGYCYDAIGTDPCTGTWATAAGTIDNGDYVWTRQTSSVVYETETITTLTIGTGANADAAYSVTTKVASAAGTVGNDGTPGVNDGPNTSGRWYIARLSETSPSNGTLQSYGYSIRENAGGTRGIEFALYNDNAGSPGTLIANSRTGDVSYTAASDKTTIEIAPEGSVTITAGVQYWIGVQHIGYSNGYYTDTTADNLYDSSAGQDGPPVDIGALTITDLNMVLQKLYIKVE